METLDLAVSMRSVGKTYKLTDVEIEVLKDINLDITTGEFVTICGPSGAGKTTLLNLVSGIDKPTIGTVLVFGEELTEMDEYELADFRCQQIGFVFQAYNLVSTLTVAENIAFPMEWARKPEDEIENRVNELLKSVGLQNRLNHFPAQLSGGEQQRVALARALANDPSLILADEPTGNLDATNTQKIIDLLKLLKEKRKTIIVSTHDERIIELADWTVCLQDGRLTNSSV